MKGITFLLLLLCTTQIWGQLITVEADGRFYARDDDRLSFVKNQLLYSAYQDVFSREFKAMNLDSDKFWRHYEEKFAQYFLPIEEAIEKKYTDEKTGKIRQKREMKKAIRHKKLELKSRYGGLRNAIPRYSVIKRLRSPEVPNSRYIRIKAYVDRKALHKIYLQFTTSNPDRHFSTLYVSPSFRLIDTSWVETGVEVENDHTQTLENSWRKKIEASLGGKIDRIVFADSTLSTELEDFFRLTKEARELNAPEGVTLENDFGSSLWMKLSFSIKKTKENEDSKRRNFNLGGDLLLMDLSQQKILTFDDFEEKSLSLGYEREEALSRGVANAIYQLPIGKFRELKEIILNAKVGLKRVYLEIVEYENLRDLELLTRKIGNRGIAKQFNPVIERITPNSAKISLEYAGEDDEMVALLRGLNNITLENNRVIVFPDAESPFQMALKKGEQMEKSDG